MKHESLTEDKVLREIFFDENGNFDEAKTDKCLSERLEGVEFAVIPGFYGKSAHQKHLSVLDSRTDDYRENQRNDLHRHRQL